MVGKAERQRHNELVGLGNDASLFCANHRKKITQRGPRNRLHSPLFESPKSVPMTTTTNTPCSSPHSNMASQPSRHFIATELTAKTTLPTSNMTGRGVGTPRTTKTAINSWRAALASVDTWWNIFVRQCSPEAHREGHVSRSTLLHGVARRTEHAGKTTLQVTSLHAKSAAIMAACTALSRRLKKLAQRTALQLTDRHRHKPWHHIIATIFATIATTKHGPPREPIAPVS